MSASYDVGSRVWQPDPVDGWIAAEVQKKEIIGEVVKLYLKRSDGVSAVIVTTLPALHNASDPALPPLRNPSLLEASDDLTNMSYLNEPAVLHAIKLRYAQKEIYTYSGIVLIAVNPFARVDSLYVPGMIQIYAGKHRASQAPHLFAVAEDAFANMLRVRKNQTIIVSGESGAGKTVSAKYIMRYFASREAPYRESERAKGRGEKMSEVEMQIMATNPIMEAFGNAKTTRNDNSSRFGKYIEIIFNDTFRIVGAKIRTYLLERSRLVYQPFRERNYHIFYQLLRGASTSQRRELELSSIDDFSYLNQGGSPDIQGVDDAQDFANTQSSLSKINISESRQLDMFRILSALLHCGNIRLDSSRSEASVEPDDKHLLTTCQLLGIDPTAFSKGTTKKQLVTRGEKIISNLTPQQAVVVRDSFVKYVYSSLFDWLVATINKSLAREDQLYGLTSFIGVLDIYGFEHFAKNSFEQFCINYANEKLQQEFNQHVFKLEQEEYVREKINWSFINFTDNQACIDLIEGKLGILALLDEECRLLGGSDTHLITKLNQNFAEKEPTVFRKPRFGSSAFTVCHYALDVTYEAEGFIDKNRDTVPEAQLEVLNATTNSFLLEILRTAASIRDKENITASSKSTVASMPGRKVGVSVTRKPTLGGIFRSSLIELMRTIRSTEVHYIRCIKPNEAKQSWKFEGPMVLSQLRACGVLETVRISCAGYPTRWTYEEFALRYYMLVDSTLWTSEIRQMAKVILRRVISNTAGESDTKYQFGLTKIFLRAGMLAVLEDLRTARINEAAALIQRSLQSHLLRRKFLAIRNSINAFQSYSRASTTRKHVIEVRVNMTAKTIQSFWRASKVRKSYKAVCTSVTRSEAVARGFIRRKQILEHLRYDAARTIQQKWRSKRQIGAWRDYRRKTVIIQTLWRGLCARKAYKSMREEARDLKQISYKLENKVVELTQTIATMKKENKGLAGQVESYEHQLKTWKNRTNTLENRAKELQGEVNEGAIIRTNLDVLKAAHEELKDNYNLSAANLRRKHVDEESSSKSLDNALIALEKLKSKNETLESQNSSLQQLLSDLKEKEAFPGNPGAMNGDAEAQLFPAASSFMKLTTNRKLKRRSTGPELMDVDRISTVYNPRPVSMFPGGESNNHHNPSGTSTKRSFETVENELETILSEERYLNEEVIYGLIKALKIPPPSTSTPLTEKEILFPAYLINLVTSEMWNNGFVKESERFLANVMQTIQQEVMQYSNDEAISSGAFWLSNVHEMLSFVFLAEDWYEAQKSDNHDYDRLLEIVKHDLESLEFNIYHTWMKVLKRKLYKMIVPAVIESQSLPGFITNDNNRFLGKLLQTNSTPSYSMDNLLSLLNTVFRALKTYFLESSIVTQCITELLHLVGVTAFNDLLMRRNFLSWKRGLQINYNITRIEEWCKSHDMPEGTLQLEHLMQATKLLQLKKATMNDIEIIQDICWMLSPSQIQKLLNQYLIADYEQPINGDIMKAVASKVTEREDVLLLAAVDMEDSGPYEIAEPREITALETYIPSWLQTPRLKRLVEIVSQQAIAQEEKDQTQFMENGDDN